MPSSLSPSLTCDSHHMKAGMVCVKNYLLILLVYIDTIYLNTTVLQWYLLIRTPFDSNTSQFEHIWRTNFDLQSKRGLSIRTQKTRGGQCHLPASRPISLALLSREHLSLLRLRNGFQVTPALSCLGYSGPQPWSLPTCHPSQCSLLLWSLANLFTNEDIFNTLNNQ